MTSTDNAGDEGELPRRLRRMINLRGLTRISAELGVSRHSLACYVARLDLRPCTLALIESKLSAANDVDPCPEGFTDWTCSRGYTYRIPIGATGPTGVGACPRCGSTDRKYRPLVAGVVCDQPWHDEPETAKGGAGALSR